MVTIRIGAETFANPRTVTAPVAVVVAALELGDAFGAGAPFAESDALAFAAPAVAAHAAATTLVANTSAHDATNGTRVRTRIG